MAEAVNPSLSSDKKVPFREIGLVNPLDQPKAPAVENSELIRNIVASETAGPEPNILGEAPEPDISLPEDMEPPKSLLLLMLQIIFCLIFVAGLAAVLFFTSQLTDNFDYISGRFGIPNVSKDLASTNAQIIKLQTEINFHRHLKIKGYLDKFSYSGDAFLNNYEIANSPTSNTKEKNEADESLVTLRTELKKALDGLKESFSKNFTAPLIDIKFEDNNKLDDLYKERLKGIFREKADTIVAIQNGPTKKDYKNYIQVLDIIGKNELKSLVVQADFAEAGDKEIYDFIRRVNSLVVNDLSVLQTIKNQRIKWSDIMNEIDLRTMAVDSHYSEEFYDDLGGIRYTSYEFESGSRKIAIAGETKRIFDTTNFTLIADLIDELNKSVLFENAEMRSFSKSGSLDEGYIASLRMAFNLQNDPVESQDSTVPLDELPDFLNK